VSTGPQSTTNWLLITTIHQLNRTFKDILFKLEAFSLPATRKSNEAGLNAPSAEALALEQFSGVLYALSFVMDAFEVLLKPNRVVGNC
jgi:hypothetical protein